MPAAVGVDIGCGMIAAETDIPAERFAANPPNFGASPVSRATGDLL